MGGVIGEEPRRWGKSIPEWGTHKDQLDGFGDHSGVGGRE